MPKLTIIESENLSAKKCIIILGNNLPVMREMIDNKERFNLVYVDVPYNTGNDQRYAGKSYEDSFANFGKFIEARMRRARLLIRREGSIFVHVDPRESHYVKLILDKVFGRDNFRNEIIWAYDYGGRSKKVWPKKHDCIFWYTKSETYTFDYAAIDRIPYLAPKLVGKSKARLGKTPTDVWWNTIVHTTGQERVGYPTQKPLKILERIVRVHSRPGDRCLDFFAGSGSFGEACLRNGRSCTLIDKNPQAIKVMQKRLREWL